MSRFANIVNSQTLLDYAQGAARSAIAPVADFLAPAVDVASPVGRYKIYNSKHRFRVPNTKRGLGGAATLLQFDASDATYNCTPNALDMKIDKLEQAGNPENFLKEAADDVAEVAALCHEKTVIDAALAAVGPGTDSNFTSSSVDPVDVLDAQIKAVALAAGYGSLMDIGLLFGTTAWQRYKNNANVRARFLGGNGSAKSGDGGASLVTPNLDAVSALQLGNPEARISFLVADGAQEGLSQSLAFLLDTAILIFARKAKPTRRDPSFMKTFRLMGEWMKPRTYQTEDGRSDAVGYDWSEEVAVTNSSAAARVNATNS